MNQSHPITYSLCPKDPLGHLFNVCIEIAEPNPEGQILSLPNWIPGSYLIRDFSKHLIDLHAESVEGHPLKVSPIEKSVWQLEPCQQPLKVFYQVYAWDLSVRGAHFDETHAFVNGTSAFLAVEGQKSTSCHVVIEPSEHSEKQQWKVATTLPKLTTDPHGFGDYQAKNYRDLIEYPIEMGNFFEVDFEACGIPHKVAFTGQIETQKLDTEQLKKDLIAICEIELNLFNQPYPIEEYLFQVMVVGDGYGGLEHVNSTALMCSREDLPYLNDSKRTDGYLQFLELCSHEYFHTWNVKRIMPKVYQQADLSEPVYTNQLWWFEGITSYFDGLFLNMAGIVDDKTYLKRLAKEMTRVYRMPGRFKQSVAESSFLTWTKFYQQDENAPNAIISYYTKGSLIALGLDLTIRAETQNQKSLIDVLLHLWQHYGATGKGLKEGEIEAICSQVSGVPLKHFFNAYLYGTEDLPFEELFKPFGIEFSLRQPSGLKDLGGPTEEKETPLLLGANLTATEHQTTKISHVWQNSPAYHAGLSAGDEIIALNNYKMTSPQTLETYLKRCNEGEKLSCHYFRRDELRSTEIILQATQADRVVLVQQTEQNSDNLSWLSGTEATDA